MQKNISLTTTRDQKIHSQMSKRINIHTSRPSRKQTMSPKTSNTEDKVKCTCYAYNQYDLPSLEISWWIPTNFNEPLLEWSDQMIWMIGLNDWLLYFYLLLILSCQESLCHQFGFLLKMSQYFLTVCYKTILWRHKSCFILNCPASCHVSLLGFFECFHFLYLTYHGIEAPSFLLVWTCCSEVVLVAQIWHMVQ